MEVPTLNKKEAINMMLSGNLVIDETKNKILWYDKSQGIFCSQDKKNTVEQKISDYDYFDVRTMKDYGWSLLQH